MNALPATGRLTPGVLLRPPYGPPAAWVLGTLLGLFVVLPALEVSVDQTLIRSTPFILAGLAVALPARAGLINVGGEGQLLLGAVGATGVGLALPDTLSPVATLPLLALGGALGGLVWAGIAAGLYVGARTNEVIVTLLLNSVAVSVVAYVVHGPWRDADSASFPYTADFGTGGTVPLLPGGTAHAGLLVALAAAVGVWLLMGRTRWGFRARVVGGNKEAGRRSGFNVSRTLVIALVAGGALAGLAGAIEVVAVEGRLRPAVAVGFGYIGFLASWLVGHRPLAVVGAGLLLAAISVSGDNLQIDFGLPSTTVYILMAFVVMAVLGLRRRGAGRQG